MNKVAYIVPVYNVNKYLDECLSSLKKISTSKEIIIVDDLGSQDPYPIIKPYLEDSNFTYIKNKRNLGLGFARNEAIKKVSKDVTHIYFVDSDDYVISEAVDKAFKELEPDTSLVYESFYRLTKESCVKAEDEPIARLQNGKSNISIPPHVWGSFWTVAQRKSLDFSQKFFEDMPYIAKRIKEGGHFKSTKKITYVYRQRKSSIVNSKNSVEKLNDFSKLVDSVYSLGDIAEGSTKDVYATYCELLFKMKRSQRKAIHKPKYENKKIFFAKRLAMFFQRISLFDHWFVKLLSNKHYFD